MGSFTNNGTTSVSVTNVPYTSYEVIAYVGNEGNSPNGNANGRNASINIGGTTYYYSTDTNDAANPFVYVPITNTTSGTYPAGNYAVFTGLTSSSFSATLTNLTLNSGLDGLEIVTSMPSTTLANPLTLSSNSTIDVTGYNAANLGNLTVTGSNTLFITGGSTGANVPYSVSLGSVALSGNTTFSIANNTVGGGKALGTLTLGFSERQQPHERLHNHARRPRRRDARFPRDQPRAGHRRQH